MQRSRAEGPALDKKIKRTMSAEDAVKSGKHG